MGTQNPTRTFCACVLLVATIQKLCWEHFDMSTPCQDFQRGKCFRDNCRYSHADANGFERAPQVQSCKEFARGMCTRGGQCKFSHSGGGDRMVGSTMAAPGYATYGGFPPGPPHMADQYAAMYQYHMQMMNPMNHYNQYTANPFMDSRGPQMCRDFQVGKCTRGGACKFAHAGAAPRKNPCSDFARGRCEFGDNCRYSHAPEVASGAVFSQNCCRDFQSGSCSRGDSCRYSHQAPSKQCRDWAMGRCARARCIFLHGELPPPPSNSLAEETKAAEIAAHTAAAQAASDSAKQSEEQEKSSTTTSTATTTTSTGSDAAKDTRKRPRDEETNADDGEDPARESKVTKTETDREADAASE